MLGVPIIIRKMNITTDKGVTMTQNRPSQTANRRRSAVLLGGLVGLTSLVASACFQEPPAGGGTTTSTMSSVKTLTNASFEWTFSEQTNVRSMAPGQPNYWSAGVSDSTQATYNATDGGATVLKKNAAGTYVPIGSEPAVDWAHRHHDGTGVIVTPTVGNYGQKVRFTGGTGTVNTSTGASTIQWTGTFTINFYGSYTPFWIKNPKLEINASGQGSLTALVGGIKSDQLDPSIRITLPDRTVTVASFTGVSGANSTGFTSTPTYLGTTVTLPSGYVQVAQNSGNASYWGSWPQSFVDFQIETGNGAYWYTSGGAADPKKPTAPLTVAYNIAP